MNEQIDKKGELSRSIVSNGVENPKALQSKILNLISINSIKISPLRVAPVEMTAILLESVNGRIVDYFINVLK